jgi:hypothetical protein
MSLILLNLAGGDCVDDLSIFQGDPGFSEVMRRVETHGMPRRERRAFLRRLRKERKSAVRRLRRSSGISRHFVARMERPIGNHTKPSFPLPTSTCSALLG